jgi:hypothetical protein
VLGRFARAGARAGKERKGKAAGLGSRGPVGWWPTRGVRGLSLDLNLNSLFKFKSHTFEIANGKIPSKKNPTTIPNQVYPQKVFEIHKFC